MCITTMTSLFSTLLAIGIHQQYVNAYSKALRVDFAANYGYMVGVLTMLLVVGAVCLWGAMSCVFIVTYNEIAAYIGLSIMFVGGWGAVSSSSLRVGSSSCSLSSSPSACLSGLHLLFDDKMECEQLQ
jgi:hypothetical protein